MLEPLAARWAQSASAAPKVILASASPRRKEILGQTGIPFAIGKKNDLL